jgi:hypothetical protein
MNALDDVRSLFEYLCSFAEDGSDRVSFERFLVAILDTSAPISDDLEVLRDVLSSRVVAKVSQGLEVIQPLLRSSAAPSPLSRMALALRLGESFIRLCQVRTDAASRGDDASVRAAQSAHLNAQARVFAYLETCSQVPAYLGGASKVA